MARTRANEADKWMPPRVYIKGPSFVFRPVGGGSIRLCAATAKQSEVWQAYEALINEDAHGYKVSKLISDFFASADFIELSKTTQADYRKNSKPVLLVFGAMQADAVEPRHVRAYMDKRGLKSRVQANREKAFFSRAYRWGYERGKVKGNPCKGVKQFKEQARTRYVTDPEYQAVYQAAQPAVKVAMEISYLCAARKGDVLAMRWDQVLEDGIFIQQGKTGIKQIKLFSERLLEAIAMARDLSRNQLGAYVVVKPDGHPYTDNGFNSAWRETMLRAREQTGWPLDFTFHDLKAKAISDIDGTSRDKQAISGHKTEGQVAVYDRSVKRVATVDAMRKKPEKGRDIPQGYSPDIPHNGKREK